MRFTIISTKADHQPPQNSYSFYAPGGTIGRDTDNNLVLPDKDRIISRLQAIVHVTANGECRITNSGSVTQVMVNDIPLQRGHQAKLQNGDILAIDEYRLVVNEPNQPVPQTVSAPPDEPADVPVMNAASTLKESMQTAVPPEIWENLMQEFSISDNLSRDWVKQQSADGYNPFDAPNETERNPENPLAMFESDEPLFERQNVETDKLFNYEEPFNTNSIFSNPTPTTLIPSKDNKREESVDKEQKDELDPLALFDSSGAVMPTRADDPLGLMGGAPLTSTEEPAKVLKAASIPEMGKAQQFTTFAGEHQKLSDLTRPAPQNVVHIAVQKPQGLLGIDPVESKTPGTGVPHPPATRNVLQGELLDALLEGMGLADTQPVPQFDGENMRQLGQMVSMFSQGTVALLSSRSILKRGVKADITMVLGDANNPFKLLPSGKTVLMQMFGTRMPGFMPPQKAVRNALIDLQAHQLGMISGIRAIIAEMLQSFNPEQLEEAARQDGATSRLPLPVNRKAALWSYFVRTYGETVGEVEDDFHTLFGEAFLYAYDMEVNQYKASQSGAEE